VDGELLLIDFDPTISAARCQRGFFGGLLVACQDITTKHSQSSVLFPNCL